MNDPAYHKDVQYDVIEHGRKWAICRCCGAQWADHGRTFELVKEGNEDAECWEIFDD